MRSLLLGLLLILAAFPASAQEVRRDSLNGWGSSLGRFRRAAEKAGRTDWPSTREGRPGTAVQVTFDPKNADISLVTPSEYGLDRLLAFARTLAARLGFPRSDFITVEGKRTVIVDIEMNKHLGRERFASRFDLDLSALAGELSRSDLPQPVVIGVKKDAATTISGTGAAVRLAESAWFAAPAEVSPGTQLKFDFRVSWRVIPGLALFIVGPLFLVLGPLLARRKRASAETPVPETLSAEEVQRQYDRRAPAWVMMLGLTLLPLALFFVTDPERMITETHLLLGFDATWVMLGVVGISTGASLITAARRKREISKADPASLTDTSLSGELDRPPLWATVGWLGVLGLGMLAGPALFLIPVYTPEAQKWLRFGVLGWMGLCVIGAVVVGWLGRRACRTELRSGPHFEMVAELSARAKVPVRHVVLLRSPIANAFASPWGTVGLTTSLVRQLQPEELRVVIAHELGHLKLRHPQRTMLLSLLALSAVFAFWWGIGSLVRPHVGDTPQALLDSPIFYITLGPMLQMLLIGRGMRAREEQADRLAVQWTGDPELLIRALERLHHLSQTPGQLKPSDEAISTHPSLVRRVEAIRASAAHAG